MEGTIDCRHTQLIQGAYNFSGPLAWPLSERGPWPNPAANATSYQLRGSKYTSFTYGGDFGAQGT